MNDKPFIEFENDGSTMVITPLRTIGSLEAEDVKPELDFLLERLEHLGVRQVVIDFSRVEYIGSSMLEALRRIWKKTQAAEGQMALCNAGPVVREVLAVARFDTIWKIYETRDDALAAVGAE